MNVPEGLLYTQEHEWLRREGEEYVVGVTDYAQHEMGDVVQIELPAAGKAVEAGASLAVLETVKSVNDVYAPIAGTITGTNPDLAKTPELVNQDCYGRGWMVRLKPAAGADLTKLLSAADYKKLIGA